VNGCLTLPSQPEEFRSPKKEGARAIYFPSCISRIMGRLPTEPKDRSLMEVTVELARRAGVPVYIPSDVAGTCCGMPFSSKGFTRAHAIAAKRSCGTALAMVRPGQVAGGH